MVKLLFVCTGNICRSPTAEGVMRHHVEAAGLDDAIQIDSAGTQGFHAGEAPDTRSAATAKARGVSLDGQVARQVTADDFYTFDLLLALDRGHETILRRKAPQGMEEKVVLFLDYVGVKSDGEVPDPYYGGASGFEQVYNLIDQGCQRLLDRVQTEYGVVA